MRVAEGVLLEVSLNQTLIARKSHLVYKPASTEIEGLLVVCQFTGLARAQAAACGSVC